MITRYIAELLYHNDCVIVPGLGGFIKAYNSARILHTTHEFFPPSGVIAFNAGLSGNDGLLATYIASAENKSYSEALLDIRQWVGKSFETMKQGDKLSLAGIGDIFLNSSGNTEFIPSKQINFNADSFGLPVFFAKPVDSESYLIPELQPDKYKLRNTKLRRLVPETLKWAAVLAPFVAFGLWGALNGNFVNNYVHNYTGMYSWMRSTPGKTVTDKLIQLPVTEKEKPVEILPSPSEVMAEKNIDYNPGVVSYSELAKQNINISDNKQPEIDEIYAGNQRFHIIGGAFRDHNNALKLIATLQEQGYPAAIVDTTSGGLYVVSMKGCSSMEEASTQLTIIKEAGYAASWILKKHS